MNPSLTDFKATYSQCDSSLARNKSQSLKATFQALADATEDSEKQDVYGTGDLIEEFEKEIAELLGKEAALFLPSGTMAQPIALRIWSEEKRTPYVALHATSHLQLHEQNSYQTLWGLRGVTLGQSHQVPTLEDIQTAAAQPLAAALLELPMREIGGQLPEWDALVSQTQFLKEQGIRVHMDGARLWQCPAYYGKSLAEISALFDSVYVSFYKDLGGISGAILAGDAHFVAQAKIWARRAGGNLYSLAPYVVAAREGFKQHFGQIHDRRLKAIWVAETFNEQPEFSTIPLVPQTNMFRMRIHLPPEKLLAAATKWMQENNTAIVPAPYEMGEDYCLCEITIGDAIYDFTYEEWQAKLASFFAALREG
jgi:threonine aldolase